MHFRNYGQLSADVFHEMQPHFLKIKLIKRKYPQLPFTSPAIKSCKSFLHNLSNKPAFIFPLISLLANTQTTLISED